jgi:hypothetical protein
MSLLWTSGSQLNYFQHQWRIYYQRQGLQCVWMCNSSIWKALPIFRYTVLQFPLQYLYTKCISAFPSWLDVRGIWLTILHNGSQPQQSDTTIRKNKCMCTCYTTLALNSITATNQLLFTGHILPQLINRIRFRSLVITGDFIRGKRMCCNVYSVVHGFMSVVPEVVPEATPTHDQVFLCWDWQPSGLLRLCHHQYEWFTSCVTPSVMSYL